MILILLIVYKFERWGKNTPHIEFILSRVSADISTKVFLTNSQKFDKQRKGRETIPSPFFFLSSLLSLDIYKLCHHLVLSGDDPRVCRVGLLSSDHVNEFRRDVRIRHLETV